LAICDDIQELVVAVGAPKNRTAVSLKALQG
jgi:hypothetical protein